MRVVSPAAYVAATLYEAESVCTRPDFPPYNREQCQRKKLRTSWFQRTVERENRQVPGRRSRIRAFFFPPPWEAFPPPTSASYVLNVLNKMPIQNPTQLVEE